MVKTHILGYPRIGEHRQLKFALEAYWRGERSPADLQATASALCAAHWQKQQQAGLAFITSHDFSLYDHVLDHALLFGAVPQRFAKPPFGSSGWTPEQQYFALARGTLEQPALEMTKWLDTNYHYLVPELNAETRFELNAHDFLLQLDAAQQTGQPVKPVLLGPVSLLYLSKAQGIDKLQLLDALAAQYAHLLQELAARNIDWLQIDEPILALDLSDDWLRAFGRAYAWFRTRRPKVLLTTYFASVLRYQSIITDLPVDGLHIDVVRAPEQLMPWVNALPGHWVLSVGIVDGRNIWRLDLDAALATLADAAQRLSSRLWLAPSCSLLHVPVTLQHELALDTELRDWLAFADEKLQELRVLGVALNHGPEQIADELAASRAAVHSRRHSSRVISAKVRDRIQALTAQDAERDLPFAQRQALQQQTYALPLLPTTTIGSFPQTADIRSLRAAFKKGSLSASAYQQAIRAHIAQAISEQEALGLDVLVHGEAERNDMVEYFGEQLSGYAFTTNGWVQSYGSRCVKPPLIYGDIARPAAMTVDTIRYAQSLTQKPVKGMLTGPITMLQWSFVRNDQPREQTALQLALAIRDEVDDLQRAGVGMIQIDEAALREGLPLQKAAWPHYLAWAVRAFKLTAAVAWPQTQIHTHMCYSEFNDILPSIAAMDADVITIETSRSQMALLDGFASFAYPNQIGPGVYDIHSPRVPEAREMEALLRRAMAVIPPQQLWVNPDCGLKTRGWAETRAALQAMVSVAHKLRAEGLTPPAIAA